MAGSARISTLLGLCLALCGTALGAPASGGPPGKQIRLQIASFDPLLAPPAVPPGLRLRGEPEAGYFVVQLRGKVGGGVLERLRARGGEPVGYLPDDAYIVRLRPGAKAALRSLAEVRWLGPVQPGWKISPDLGRRAYRDPSRRAGGLLRATIDLFRGENLQRAVTAVSGLGVDVLGFSSFSDTRRLHVRATREQLEQVARLPAVAWIEEAGEATQRNDTAHWVIQSDVMDFTPVWDHGLHGEGQILGLIDGPVDLDSCFFEDPVDNTPGPTHRKVVAYRSSGGTGADFHGTHVAGTLAGDARPVTGSSSAAGHAYEARLSFTSLADVDGLGGGPSNLYDFLVAAHQDGARVHSNSWGDDGTTAYTVWSRDVDLFSHDFEDSLVVFAVSNLSTLHTPENAKNLLAVAASHNGLAADSFCVGGAGPTQDGRRKPEILAPGCGIVSARNSSPCQTQSLSGTSMATPAVAAAGALVRQYFLDGWYPDGAPQAENARDPSGALVKAMLVNSAVDIGGLAGFPGDQEGWGRLLLDNALYFAGDSRRLAVLADVRNADGLSTGSTDAFVVDVTGAGEPIELTLVYTDPPPPLMASAATINDLDLEVVAPDGSVFRGNALDSAVGTSVPGGPADPINNVEEVLLPSPAIGEWLVRVRGTQVNEGPQGYALVATGDLVQEPGGSVRYLRHDVIDDGPYANGNGGADPGETITLPVTLFNLRPSSATAVSARLFSSDFAAATVTGGVAQYPDIPSNDEAVSLPPHFQLTLSPDVACEDPVPLMLRSSHAQGGDDSSFLLLLGRRDLDLPATDVPILLPKASNTPTVSTIEVADPTIIEDILVTVRVAHQEPGELLVSLTSPAGTTVVLHSLASVPLDATFDSERQPDGPGTMGDFDGEDAQGTWTLSVRDNVLGLPPTPEGTLTAWSLHIQPAGGTSCEPFACPGEGLPAEVAPTMSLAAEGDDLRLSWDAVTGATGYRVWRSADAQFRTAELVGFTTAAELVEPGGAASAASWYYRVRAVNSCEQEGP